MDKSKPTEDTRVKLPALFHITRLGYTYLSLKDYLQSKNNIDAETNIFIDIFKESISKINKSEYSKSSTELVVEFLAQSLGTEKAVHKLSDSLSNEDLGRKFYNYLVNGIDVEGCPEKIKLIDFEHPEITLTM